MTALEKLAQIGIVPVVEVEDAAQAKNLASAVFDGGLKALELTFRTPSAALSIAMVREAFPDLLLLAGTVTEVNQVDEAQKAGADLLVSPGLHAPVVEHARGLGLTMLPGVSTPTEIETARRLGVRTVKVFPAELLGGVRLIRALQGPFREMHWAPSGGITIDNLGTYLAIDSIAACSGTWIAPREDIAAGNFAVIQERAEAACAVVRSTRADQGSVV